MLRVELGSRAVFSYKTSMWAKDLQNMYIKYNKCKYYYAKNTPIGKYTTVAAEAHHGRTIGFRFCSYPESQKIVSLSFKFGGRLWAQ